MMHTYKQLLRPSPLVLLLLLLPLNLILILLPSSLAHSGPGIFPFESASYEEYDYTVLDPHSGSGAPFGGFSRATRSRLAQLPLLIPEGMTTTTTTTTIMKDDFYMQVTDHHGQRYICRMYHEDELLPESLEESMFIPPKFNHQLSSSISTSQHHDEAATTTTTTVAVTETDSSASPLSLPAATHEDATVSTTTSSSNQENSMRLTEAERQRLSHDDKIVSVQLLLSELEGICGQRHTGDWWSYEWCYETHVHQFHVRINNKKKQRNHPSTTTTTTTSSPVLVEAVSSLGTFHSRTTLVDHLEDITLEPYQQKLLNGKRELARVIDEYKNGEICNETGERRQSYVHLMCCDDPYLEKGKGLLHRKGEKLNIPLATVTHVMEHPTCSYNITVCTSLLCHMEEDEPNQQQQQHQNEKLDTSDGTLTKNKQGKKNEEKEVVDSHWLTKRRQGPKSIREPLFPVGSVRDILDKALGHKCLQSDTGGWWTYEFCHTRRVRQYHDEIVSETTSTGAVIMSKVVESEHILGWYKPELGEAYPHEDWRFVHNVTDLPMTTMKSAMNERGNGAYFEIEYTGGNICDHTDVTDAAIVAGAAGTGTVVERSTSVRYSCGNIQSMSVNEDTTCHYVVHVKLPELCEHPLFMAPVAKQQVVKCLPVL